MARFLVTSGTTFTPFTYDELTKPLAQMAEAQNRVQDAYDTIGTESEALRRYIEQEPENSEARMMYDNYMSKLRTLQENLWNNGYTAQSRRDLAAAKAGYASDVTRLASAIKQRQDASKIYDAAKLKDPTLIAEDNPGLAPLDKYLKDDRYGSSWYSYSGKDFTKEVEEDAKNRIHELISEDAYLSGIDPSTPGYIIQKVNEGYSSDDVIAARGLVTGIAELYRNPNTRSQAVELAGQISNGTLKDSQGNVIPDSVRILSDVLLNHVVSSGALDSNISNSELARHIGFGAQGLSGAIGKTTINNLNDYNWIYSNDPSKTGNGGGKSGSGKNDEDSPTRSYDPSGIIVEQGRTKQAARIASRLHNSFYSSYMDADGNPRPRTLIVPEEAGGNNARTFNDFTEATEYIYHTKERDDILNKYGIDIGNIDKWDKNDLGYSIVPVSDNTERSRLKNLYGSSIPAGQDSVFDYMNYLVKKDGRIDGAATIDVAKAYKEYTDRLNGLKELNKSRNVDLEKLAMSPKEEEALRKKYDIDPRVDWRDVPTVIASKSKSWTVSDATLANHKTPTMLKDIEDWILLTYNGGGPNGSASRLRFRKVNPDTSAVDEEGVKNGIKAVFDTDKDGNVKSGSLLGVSITPDNMINGEITLITKKGKFICSMDYLGETMQDSLTGTITFPDGRGGSSSMSMPDAIRVLATPIYDAEATLVGDGSFDADIWKNLMNSFTHETLEAYGLTRNRDGKLYDPDDIVRNDALLSNLYRLVKDFIGMKAGFNRDYESLHVNEVVSHTADKKNPSTYIE